MTSNEMTEVLLKGGKGEKAAITGNRGDFLTALRFFKKERIKIGGLVEVNQSDYKGTNIRKVDLSDPGAVFSVFNPFTREDKDNCRKPVVDGERNGLVATDGWKMLVCRIPARFPIAGAVPSGFAAQPPYRWWEVAEDIEPTEYALTSYCRMATIRKGDERHGLVQAFADAVRAYSHNDGDGCWNTLRLKIGGKFYDAVAVDMIVDALFKLGCTTVALCEKTSWAAGHISEYTPLHVFGFGGEMDAKGVLMPLRWADDSMGAFVMPLDGAAERKEVA